MHSYLRVAYWAIKIANLDNKSIESEIFMKKFLYFFIMDLGISPFVKCYKNKSILQACISSKRFDFLRELLSHTYEVLTPNDIEVFKKSCKGKDLEGNNIFHDIFLQNK
jgi:hypothetical protein